jgi:hypothetical protein
MSICSSAWTTRFPLNGFWLNFIFKFLFSKIQGGSNMTNCDLFTHNQSRSYLNHLVCRKNSFH